MEATNVFFSVCIPVYNGEKFLAPCIDSVLAQTEHSFEILLVDDGSQDASGRICDAYAQKHPNVRVLHKENQGPMLARHDAVRMARGSFLTFLDADDLYLPHTLRRLRQVQEETQGDLILFDVDQVYPDGKRIRFTEHYAGGTVFQGPGKQQLYQDFILGNRMNAMYRKCIRRELYDARQDLSEYAGLIQGEDKLASLPCIDAAQKVVYIKESLYDYRMNPQGTSYNFTLRNYRDIQRVHTQVAMYIQRWRLPEAVSQSQYSRKVRVGCLCARSLAMRIRQKKATRQELREAMAYIAADPDFQRGRQADSGKMSRADRLVSRLILRQADGTLCLLSRIVAFGKAISQK